MLSSQLKSLTDLRNNPLLVSQLAADEGPVYILNRNKPISVILDARKYEELLDRLEDALDALEIIQLKKTAKKSDFIPLEEVERKLGIT